jgi:hypothetical protein
MSKTNVTNDKIYAKLILDGFVKTRQIQELEISNVPEAIICKELNISPSELQNSIVSHVQTLPDGVLDFENENPKFFKFKIIGTSSRVNARYTYMTEKLTINDIRMDHDG